MTTDSDVYFELLRTTLGDIGSLDPVREGTRVEQIHHSRLGPFLYQRDTKDVHQLLNETGFTDLRWCTDNAYAGLATIVTAKKSAIVMLGGRARMNHRVRFEYVAIRSVSEEWQMSSLAYGLGYQALTYHCNPDSNTSPSPPRVGSL